MLILISPFSPSFHVVDESLVGYLITARCWVVTRKIPVAEIFRASRMKVVDGLIDHLNISKDVVRANDL